MERAPVGLDLSWVLPSLAVGARLPAGSERWLAEELAIRGVVDLRSEDRDGEELAAHGIELLYLPTPDMHAVAHDMLSAGVRWVQDALDRGERVLVHCQHGIGRSVLLTCCVLVGRGASPREALARVKAVRPSASPSPEQLQALLDWSQTFRAARGLAPVPERWHDLATVAYAHLAYGREPP